MARPHIEFVQTQNIDWQMQPDGSQQKLLNADPDSAEATLLVRYPAGFAAPTLGPDDPAEEYFVLDSALRIDDRARGAMLMVSSPLAQALVRAPAPVAPRC